MVDGQNASGGFSEADEVTVAGPAPDPVPDEERESQALLRMMAAREAWHAARGELRPPGAPDGGDSPEELRAREAERRFLAAREEWLRRSDAPPGGG